MSIQMEHSQELWLWMNTYIFFTAASHSVDNQVLHSILGHFYVQVSVYAPVHHRLSQAKSQCHHQHSPQPTHCSSPWFLKQHGVCAHLYSCSQMFLSCKPVSISVPESTGVGNVLSSTLYGKTHVLITGWCSMTWKNTLSNKAWMVTGL